MTATTVNLDTMTGLPVQQRVGRHARRPPDLPPLAVLTRSTTMTTPVLDRTETDRTPVAFEPDTVFHVIITRLPYLDRLAYWVSSTGRTLAVRFIGAKAPGQRNPHAVSPVLYLRLSELEPGLTDDMLVNVAAHKLQAWLRRTQARYELELLIVACRPCRETHRDILRTVNLTVKGRYGSNWWGSDAAVRLAKSTLRQFGVAV